MVKEVNQEDYSRAMTFCSPSQSPALTEAAAKKAIADRQIVEDFIVFGMYLNVCF